MRTCTLRVILECRSADHGTSVEPIEPAEPLTFRKKKKGNLNAVRNLVFWYKKITLIGNFLLRPCSIRND